MLPDIMADFAAGVWALRWVIGGALALWGLAWALERHLSVLRDLAAARRQVKALKGRVDALQKVTGALAVTAAHSDPHPEWVDDFIAPQWYDGRS